MAGVQGGQEGFQGLCLLADSRGGDPDPKALEGRITTSVSYQLHNYIFHTL